MDGMHRMSMRCRDEYEMQRAKERAGVCDDDDDNGDDDDHDDDDHDDDEGDRYPKRFQHILKRQRYPWP
ncbi:hypothetical protein TURU_012009 [Turdus rufiventris]|nr:hypothetical protein TURU_012009 [Turdus rufiventris]